MFGHSSPFQHFDEIQTKLLVSCPKDPNSAGGLFIIDFKLKNIRKVLEADCRGVTCYPNGFFLATNSNGILKLDHECNVITQYDIPSLDLHGLKMD